jgi:hypothetical protein
MEVILAEAGTFVSSEVLNELIAENLSDIIFSILFSKYATK